MHRQRQRVAGDGDAGESKRPRGDPYGVLVGQEHLQEHLGYENRDEADAEHQRRGELGDVPRPLRGVVLVVGLPLSLAVALNALPEGETKAQKAQNRLKGDLTETCLNYAFSGRDTKAERAAKDKIDERLGGGADYAGVCKWVLG